jgi:plasmid stabilization system protein ParE
MKFNVIITPDASRDIESIADWYESQVKGLGKRFYKEAKKHIRLLYNNANSFAVKYDDVHCLKIKRFPCLIHYKVTGNTVIVYAVINTSRNPDIWKEKIK